MRVKPTVGYQKEDLRISGNRVGVVDATNRGKKNVLFKHKYRLVKEEFECNELFTPDMAMSRIFDQSVSTLTCLMIILVPTISASTDRGCKRFCLHVRCNGKRQDALHGGLQDRSWPGHTHLGQLIQHT